MTTPALTRQSTYDEVIAKLQAEQSVAAEPDNFTRLIRKLNQSRLREKIVTAADLVDNRYRYQQEMSDAGIGGGAAKLLYDTLDKEGVALKPLTRESDSNALAEHLFLVRENTPGKQRDLYSRALLAIAYSGFPDGFDTVGDLLDNEKEARKGFVKGRLGQIGKSTVDNLYTFLKAKGLQANQESNRQQGLELNSDCAAVMNALGLAHDEASAARMNKIMLTRIIHALASDGMPQGYDTAGKILADRRGARAAFQSTEPLPNGKRRVPMSGAAFETLFAFLEEHVPGHESGRHR